MLVAVRTCNMARSGRGRGRDRRRRATATARPCAGHTASPRRTGGRVSTLCRITSEAEHHYKLSLDSPVSAPASCACGSWELGARWVCACTRRLCRVTVDLDRSRPVDIRYDRIMLNGYSASCKRNRKIVPHVPHVVRAVVRCCRVRCSVDASPSVDHWFTRSTWCGRAPC